MTRAIEPALEPPSFDPPKISCAKRISGFVNLPGDSEGLRSSIVTSEANPLDWQWNSISALNFNLHDKDDAKDVPSKFGQSMAAIDLGSASANRVDARISEDVQRSTYLTRTSSVARNVLLITEDGVESTKEDVPKLDAIWLQRKIGETMHNGVIRVGFALKLVDKLTFDESGENDKKDEDNKMKYEGKQWEVIASSKESDGVYPFEIVTVKIQPKETATTSENDTLSDTDRELAALQMVSSYDPSGGGNVVTTQHKIAACGDHVYTIMPYHKEGSLFDYLGEMNGPVSESLANIFFRQILNGLQTLKTVGMCHRNINLDTVVLRGDCCLITSLDCALRIPSSNDESGNEIVHLIKTQPAVGRNPQFIAPEIFRNEPFDGHAIDLWASAIILFILLFGADPLFAVPIVEDRKFQQICMHHKLKEYLAERSSKSQKQKVESSPGNSTTENVADVSDAAIDLLQHMLKNDPQERYDLEQVLGHTWCMSD